MEKRSNYPKHEGYEPTITGGNSEGYKPESATAWMPPRTIKYPPSGGSSKVEVNVTLDYVKKPMKLYKLEFYNKRYENEFRPPVYVVATDLSTAEEIAKKYLFSKELGLKISKSEDDYVLALATYIAGENVADGTTRDLILEA